MCRYPARRDVKRHVPPMVQPRMHCQPYLADDLAVEMQCILCRPPRVKRNIGESLVFHILGTQAPSCARLDGWQLFEIHFIGIAVTPFFVRLERFYDRVCHSVVMLCRVAVWRIVAAADMAAEHAQSQMHPAAAYLQAVLTPIGAWRYRYDLG